MKVKVMDAAEATTSTSGGKPPMSKRMKRLQKKKQKIAALLLLADDKADDSPSTSDSEVHEDQTPTHSRKRKHGESGNLREKYRNYLNKKRDHWERPSFMVDHNFLCMKRNKDLQLSQSSSLESHCPIIHCSDVQQMLLYALLVRASYYRPKWCSFQFASCISQVSVVILDGVRWTDVRISNPSSWRHTNLIFAQENMVRVTSPCVYGTNVMQDLFMVPLPSEEIAKQKTIRQLNVAEDGVDNSKMTGEKMKTVQLDVENLEDKFPRLLLLLSKTEMILEGFPVPCGSTDVIDYPGFLFSKESYHKVSANSKMFALDCEMVCTTSCQSELASICVINEKLETVYETLVKPDNKITDYLTRFSGMTSELLDPVTTRLEDVQEHLRDILPPDAILCGQSLNSDLVALKLFHPYVIDTSVIYNLKGMAHCKTGLKRLAAQFLGKEIQCGGDTGHSASEDAITTMELILLKLQNNYTFGNVFLNGVTETPDKFYYVGNTCEGKTEEQQSASNDSKLSDAYNNKKDESSTTLPLHTCIQPLHAFNRSVIPQLEARLFDLITNAQKEVAIVCGSGDAVPGDKKLNNITTKHKNRSRAAATVELFEENKDLIVTQFDCQIDGNKTTKNALKIDSHIYDLYSSLKPDGLMVVLCSGTLDQHGGLFMSVKPRQSEFITTDCNQPAFHQEVTVEPEDPYDIVYGGM